jgi:hypothetical protein
MSPDELIELARRKNSAHRTLNEAKFRVRRQAGGGRTEKDRDIEMDYLAAEQREIYENLCDEWTVSMANYMGKNNAIHEDTYSSPN